LLAKAFPHRNIVTVDVPRAGPAPYVRGSGAALPFQNEAFAVVVASDTLEHVPPAERSQFIEELARAARDFIIVSGPYASAAAEYAERSLREIASPASPLLRWFEEHEEFGLPNLEEVRSRVQSLGFEASAIPGTNVLPWYLHFAAQALSDYFPDFTQAPHEQLAALSAIAQAGNAGQPYRYLLIGARCGERLANVADFGAPSRQGEVPDELELAHGIAKGIADGVRDFHSRDSNTPAARAAYAQQLERALSPAGQGSVLKAKPGTRLLKKLGLRR